MEIRRYIIMLQRWAWLIVVGAVVAGGTAYLINVNTRPIYQASARLLIDEAPESGGNEYAQALFEERLATTYVELLALYPVLSETVERLNLDMDPGQLKNRLNVSASSQAQIIIISVEDEDPTRAALIANTVGDVFMDLNQERESARFAASIASYEEQMETLQAEISAVERQIIELGEPDTAEEQVKLAELETARREAQIRYTEAFNTRESLRVEQARISNNLIPVEPARTPDSPIRPRVRTNTILGAAVGAILALGVVFLVEYMDDAIKSPEQVRQVADVSTLAAIHHIRGNGSGLDSWLVTHHSPRAPVSEAFRMLRTNLNFSAVDEALRTIVVTSSSPGEGKSTISANLAVVMAQTGKQVILVDSDLRRPMQHQLFGLSNNHGLTSTLLDPETPIEHQLQPAKVQGLRVLTSGPIPPNPAELLNSQRMDQIVRLLENEADIIIFDTPPVLSVADATILAPKVSGCVLVVDAGRTRPQVLSQAVERLRNANTHLLGAVLNQLKVRGSGYYYDYYLYYDYDHVRPGTARRGGLRLPGWLAALSRRS